MLPWINKKSGFVGIDISDTVVKILELQKTKDNYRVAAYAIGDDINEAVAQMPNKIKSAAIAIPYSTVMRKTISLDALLQEHEILRYLNKNMETFTGVTAQNISMDFSVLGRTKNHPDKIDIELVAAKREEIEAKMSLPQNANIKVTAIDVDAFALARAATLKQTDKNVVAIINFSATSFLLCVLKNHKAIYIKEDIITENIPQQINNELQMAATINNDPIQQILLSGEIADQDHIANQLSIPVHVANPLAEIAPHMMLCLGLALRKYDHD